MSRRTFEVDVCRIGYAIRTIEVEAETQEEADNLALDAAGNYDFNEHASDYVLEGAPAPGTEGLIDEMATLRVQKDGLAEALHTALAHLAHGAKAPDAFLQRATAALLQAGYPQFAAGK